MITCSNIAFGDQLGAQMSTFANLVYISYKNNQEICFYSELKDYKRGFLFMKYFKFFETMNMLRRVNNKIPELYCRQFLGIDRKFAGGYKRIYKSSRVFRVLDRLYFKYIINHYKDFTRINYLQNSVHAHSEILTLNTNKNYDITTGLGTYQDWKEIEDKIVNLYTFNNNIIKEGNDWFKSNITKQDKEIVSLHFRKTDYLLVSSLNLNDNYYVKALDIFSSDKYQLLVFSDDIVSCESTLLSIGKNYTITYVNPSHSAAVDMYIMSLCDHNIIANSSFSFWGAMLNNNIDKKVVCPKDFIGSSSPDNMYLNGNWYPHTWTAL